MKANHPQLRLTAVTGLPAIEPGDDLATIIFTALEQQQLLLADGDVVVVAQKVISKAENRYAYLNTIKPSQQAVALAEKVNKDPRIVELILRESTEVVRYRPGVLIVAHKNGYVHANAGIDQSNILSDEKNPRVLLLPKNPDRSAKSLQDTLKTLTGKYPHIIINDSVGRAWRNGTVGMALASAGFSPVVDLVGEKDLFDRSLQATTVAVADELAAAASLLMGQGSEGLPVVIIRGAKLLPSNVQSESLIRNKEDDLFR